MGQTGSNLRTSAGEGVEVCLCMGVSEGFMRMQLLSEPEVGRMKKKC